MSAALVCPINGPAAGIAAAGASVFGFIAELLLLPDTAAVEAARIARPTMIFFHVRSLEVKAALSNTRLGRWSIAERSAAVQLHLLIAALAGSCHHLPTAPGYACGRGRICKG